MRRARALAFPLALLLALVVALGFLVEDSVADYENGVYTSRADKLRMVVPRGWRATDQPSYPGLLFWMMRSQPEGKIVLTAQAFTHALYCSWPIQCRSSHDPLQGKYACAIRQKLADQRVHVGPVQPGPKDNEASGVPSVWFEYDDGKHFLRQAVALSSDRAISLVLSAPSNDARSAHVRAFEQALRTLHTLTAEETTPEIDAGVVIGDASTVPSDAPTAIADAKDVDAGVMFESAPAPGVSPVGPCP